MRLLSTYREEHNNVMLGRIRGGKKIQFSFTTEKKKFSWLYSFYSYFLGIVISVVAKEKELDGLQVVVW